MKIYDELTNAEIVTPNTDLGYLYSGTRFVKHVDEKTEVMAGTVTTSCQQGLKRIVPAHDVYEDCLYYHAYTEAEIEAQKAEQAELDKPTLQEQVDANAAAIEELAAMMAGGVT